MRVFLTLLGFITGSLSTTGAAIAATIAFKGGLSNQQLVQNWESPFTGPATISFVPTNGTVTDWNFNVLIDNEVAFSTDEFIGTSLSNVELEQGNKIKFQATISSDDDFSFETNISIEQPSLVFFLRQRQVLPNFLIM